MTGFQEEQARAQRHAQSAALADLTPVDWTTLGDALVTHGEVVFEAIYEPWIRLATCGFVQVLVSDNEIACFNYGAGGWGVATRIPRQPQPQDKCFVALTMDGLAAAHRFQSARMAQAAGARGAVPPEPDERAMSLEEVWIINAALVSQNLALSRELAQTRQRWADAAARSDTERQRRQNAVHGTLRGIEDFIGYVLIDVGTGDNRKLCMDANGKKVALVIVDDGDPT